MAGEAGNALTHRGGGGGLQVHRLKDEVGRASELDDLAAHQTQLLVVVQHRVHVLDPDGVDWTIKHQPLAVGRLRRRRDGKRGRTSAEECQQMTNDVTATMTV